MKFGEYYCNERTLDIKLPWGGITIRVWFDAKSEEWTEEKLSQMGYHLRREQSVVHLEELLDRLAAKPGVNAVQVKRQKYPDVEVGVMAYMVPFENTEPAAVDESHPQRVLDAMEAHGCLTGDCPHNRSSECDKALADAYREAFNR
jgi:hypothetical protein